MLTLSVYSLWQFVTFGNIPRDEFQLIREQGGNIGNLVAALSSAAQNGRLPTVLNAFANMAMASSFLGVTLGLFDYIADKFQFDDSALGRFKTALVTFIPSTIDGLFFPDGFIYAIGLAGMCAVVWGCIVPALAARKSRQLFGNPLYRVGGGDRLIYLMLAYAAVTAGCYILGSLGMLP